MSQHLGFLDTGKAAGVQAAYSDEVYHSFQSMLTTQSEGSLPLVPIDAYHSIRRKSTTRSERYLPLFSMMDFHQSE